MIENARFWYSQFKNFDIDHRVLQSSDRLEAEAACIQLFATVFPTVNAKELKKLIRQETNTILQSSGNYSSPTIARICTQYLEADLKPHPIDVSAILFETMGRVVSGNFRLEGLGSDQNSELQYLRMFYPTVRTSLTIAEDDNALTGAIAAGVHNIDQAAEEQKNALTKELRSEIDSQYSIASQKMDSKEREIFNNMNNEQKGFDKYIKSTSKSLVDNIVTSADQRLTNKISALTNDLILKEAIDMWWWKAFWHKTAFWLSAIVFISMVVVPIWFGWNNWELVKVEIANLFPVGADLPFGRLLVVTVPLLGYAWVLRLVSKYLNQNLTLGDDASQRKVMARTFIQLVSEGAVKDDQDRATILHALFRPMPGAASDDDQPPNVIGMIKKEITPTQTN